MTIEQSQETKIAVLEAKVDHLIGHVKELTQRVRANEKVVASVSLLGVIACTIVGAGYFAPKAEAYPQRQQPYAGMLPDNAATINKWMNNMNQWKLDQQMQDPEFDINNALVDFWEKEYGSTGSTESEELLQLPSGIDRQSIGWRYDRRDDRFGFRPLQKGTSSDSGSGYSREENQKP